ncbi:MAG: sterol carrier family protein [Kineosporiaceae bacterium]|jgi:hypothetical protein
MPPRRRTDPETGRRALTAWLADPSAVDRVMLAVAVRWSLEEFAARNPGGTTEVRVPPFGVVQCIAGPRHTRGTPPNVVETDAATWLGLVTARLTWRQARDGGTLRASGERADLSGVLPLTGVPSFPDGGAAG